MLPPDAFAVPVTVTPERAAALTADAIFGAHHTAPAPTLVHVPLWIVTVTVRGVRLGVGRAPTDGPIGIPEARPTWTPRVGLDAEAHDRPLLARRTFPLAYLSLERMKLDASALVLAQGLTGTVLDPDVSKETAERRALDAVTQNQRPTLLSHHWRKASSRLVLYPVYITHYRYGGVGHQDHLAPFATVVDAHTGVILASIHPSSPGLVVPDLVRFEPFAEPTTTIHPAPLPRADPVASVILNGTEVQDARIAAEQCIHEGTFRPADAARQAVVTGHTFQYVPIWCLVVVTRALEVGGARIGVGPAIERITHLTAASAWTGRLRLGAGFEGSQHASRQVWLEASARVPVRSVSLDEDALLPVDIPCSLAQQRVLDTFARALGDGSRRVHLHGGPAIRSVDLAYYPVHLFTYRYAGESAGDRKDYWVAISGHTGADVGAEHPSAVRAALGKFRRLLTLGT